MFNNGGIKTETLAGPNQILAFVEHQASVGCIVPQTMGVTVGARKIVKAGTPLKINLDNLNADAVIPSAASDDSATASVTGTGITAATVTAATFKSKVSGASGVYEFSYDGTNWKLNGETATLAQYGISVTGTAANGDKITVTFAAAGEANPMNAVLLHDVDVTGGKNNGTALIFGFVNLNRIDSTTKSALNTARAITGASPLLTFMTV